MKTGLHTGYSLKGIQKLTSSAFRDEVFFNVTVVSIPVVRLLLL